MRDTPPLTTLLTYFGTKIAAVPSGVIFHACHVAGSVFAPRSPVWHDDQITLGVV